MKVCLINPPQTLLKSVGVPVMFQPTGLAYVAAVLEKEHDVTVLDACAESREGVKIDKEGRYHLGLSFDNVAERIKKIKPDVVGISVVYSVNEYAGLTVAAAVKSVDRSILTVLGGPHPSICPMETLSHPDVDYVVINEGEHTAPELFRALEERRFKELDGIHGIGFKNSGVPYTTQSRELIQDLDLLPFPARHLLPMELYHDAARLGVKSRALYNIDMGDKQYYYNSDRSTTIITSRGCPYKCNFCSINLTMGYKFRTRSARNVYAELEQCVNQYGIRHVDFEDDNLTFHRDRVKEICNLIVENNLKLTWSTPNGIRADIIDEDLVIRMRKSGCKRVFVAPESGVQDVVNNVINKKMRLSSVVEAVRLFSKHNILIDASFVIGSVGRGGRSETKLEILQTIAFALKLKWLGLSNAGFNIATPLFGTELRAEALKMGYVKESPDASPSNPGKPTIETPEFTHRDLVVLQGLAAWLVNYSLKEKMAAVWRHIAHPWPYIRYAWMLVQAKIKIQQTEKTTAGHKKGGHKPKTSDPNPKATGS
jgi:magnesium-protoporphyrin IX monomethyl ester (oxidative) cyclase